jgi:hypothetical protein
MYIYICVLICIYILKFVDKYTYIHMYMYIYVYICTHTYIYILCTADFEIGDDENLTEDFEATRWLPPSIAVAQQFKRNIIFRGIYVCKYIHIYICIDSYVYLYICMYIYINMYGYHPL